MKRERLLFIIIIAGIGLSLYAWAYELPKWFPFNKEGALEEWQEKIFKNRVIYKVETSQGQGHLSAKSDKACSGLFYKIRFSPKTKPMISWRWKVNKFPDKSKRDESENGWVEQDDYAARVYVIFPSWYFLHTETIEYVWDETLPEGTLMTSPYYGRIKLMVAESGSKNLNQWVSEERDIYQDYKKAFGKEPGRVGAIALMTDTDNTLSTAEASYKDLKVGYEK